MRLPVSSRGLGDPEKNTSALIDLATSPHTCRTKRTELDLSLLPPPQASCLLLCELFVLRCALALLVVCMWCDAWPSAGRGSNRWFFPCHCPFPASTQESEVGDEERQDMQTGGQPVMRQTCNPWLYIPPSEASLYSLCPLQHMVKTSFVCLLCWLCSDFLVTDYFILCCLHAHICVPQSYRRSQLSHCPFHILPLYRSWSRLATPSSPFCRSPTSSPPSLAFPPSLVISPPFFLIHTHPDTAYTHPDKQT